MKKSAVASVVAAPRPICEIAGEIRRTWKRVYFGAVPYLDAMGSLSAASDTYGCDSAQSVILHFLVNASTFRGEDAKRLKSELKAHLPRSAR